MATQHGQTAGDSVGAGLVGRWRVRRISGLLPPGLTKQIGLGADRTVGWTLWFGVPVGVFRVEGLRFIYRRWPVVDEIQEDLPGAFRGRGRLWGWTFCHFRLERLAE